MMGGQKGITLVEVLIVSIIAVFMMLTLMVIFSSSRGAWFMSQVQTDLYLDARRAMDEMSRELMEGSSGATATFSFLDPLTGQYTQGIWMASARGNDAIAGEDGSADNAYMHIDANDVISWRSVVIFCPYQTADGVRQLRRYVSYGTSTTFFSQPNVLPLTFVSANATTLTFDLANGVTLGVIRNGGRVLANNLGNEDSNNNNGLDANENDGVTTLPMDNEDGILNLGLNAVKSVGRIEIALFLSKEVLGLPQGGRFLTSTLRNTLSFRQP